MQNLAIKTSFLDENNSDCRKAAHLRRISHEVGCPWNGGNLLLQVPGSKVEFNSESQQSRRMISLATRAT